MREKLKTIGQDNVEKHAEDVMSTSWLEQAKREVWDSKALGLFMLFILMSAIFFFEMPEYYFPFLFHYPERSELHEVSGTLYYKYNTARVGRRGSLTDTNTFIIKSTGSPSVIMELSCANGGRKRVPFSHRNCSKSGLPKSLDAKYIWEENTWDNAKVLYHPVFGIFEISINGKVSPKHSYDETVRSFKAHGCISNFVLLLIFAPFYLVLLFNYRQYRKNNAISNPVQGSP